MRRFSHWWLDRCFVYVGRMDEAKGILQIVNAWLALFNELEGDCPSLWLVGGSPELVQNIRLDIGIDRITEHEHAGRIRWWGYLDTAGISTVLLKAYVVVCHSRYEPGGRVVLEAMSQAIPVIATPHGFAADLIEDWYGGFLVDFDDVEVLRVRMSHFALQPLLRHAMGPVAQQRASRALEQWQFLDTHFQVYHSAIEGTQPHRGRLSIARDPRASRPRPKGFAGVYPFEGEAAGNAEATGFLRTWLGADAALQELEGISGNSRLWLAEHNNQRWVIKHAFSTYRTRPMWDRSFRGSPVTLQRHRVSSEIRCSTFASAARLACADIGTGLYLREWLEPGFDGLHSLPPLFVSLLRFHGDKAADSDLVAVRQRVDVDWQSVKSDEVITFLTDIERDWHAAGFSWDAWCPSSLRLGWKWLSAGLETRTLSLPDWIEQLAKQTIDEESSVASSYEPLASFGWCHGDLNPEHFRIDPDGSGVLIDFEHLHPGFFGHDWADIVLALLSDVDADEAVALISLAVGAIPSSNCNPRLLISWLRWTAMVNACRSHALLNSDDLARTKRSWRWISTFPGVNQ